MTHLRHVTFLAALLAALLVVPAAHASEPPAPKAGPVADPNAPASEDVVIAFLKQYERDLYASALVLREKDEGKFHHWTSTMGREVTELLCLQKSDPERFGLTMEDRRLAFRALQLSKDLAELQKKRDAKREDIDATSARLLKVVSAQFDLQQKLHQRELEAQTRRLELLQRQLDGLKKDLETRAQSRDELISQRIAELMKDPHSWTKW